MVNFWFSQTTDYQIVSQNDSWTGASDWDNTTSTTSSDYYDDRGFLEQLEQEWLRQQLQQKNFRDTTEDIGFKLTTAIAVFGCLAFILNVFIMVIILVNWKTLLRHVFYILLLNFTVVDTLRGSSLLLNAVFLLKPDIADENMDSKMTTMMAEQSVLLVLKFCNLVIIFNLLLITLNEYILICHPFRYPVIINRCRVLVTVICIWLGSAAFVVLAMIARNQQNRVMVRSTLSSSNFTLFGSENSTQSPIKRQSGEKSVDLDYIFNFTMLAVCFLCLVVIIACYGSLFRVIRRIQREDDLLRQQSTNSTTKRQSFASNDQTVSLMADSGGHNTRHSRHKLLRRHKYAFVIGLVIAVYLLYLVSYSTTQILHFNQVQHNKFKHSLLIIRWSVKVLIGLHAVLQPLCYLRVKEFRAVILRMFCKRIYQQKRREAMRRDSRFSSGMDHHHHSTI